MTPIDAMTLVQGLAQEMARGLVRALPAIATALAGLGAALHALAASAAAGVQAAAGTTAEAAAARPEVMMSRLRFLSLAYTVVWVILAAYLVLLSLRQRRLERQIRRLRERLGA